MYSSWCLRLSFLMFFICQSFAESELWIVFPKETVKTGQQEEKDRKTIIKATGLETVDIRTIFSKHLEEVQFWRVRATKEEIVEVKALPGKFIVIENSEVRNNGIDLSNSTFESGGSENRIIKSRTAPIDLKIVSWPPNTELPPFSSFRWKINNFQYDGSVNDSQRIHFIDTGVNGEHEDITRSRLSRDIFYTSDAARSFDDGDPEGHGTCLISKAAGSEYGVSKFSTMIPYKTTLDVANFLEAFIEVFDRINKQKPQDTIADIIVTSFSSKKRFAASRWRDPPREWLVFQSLLQRLVARGVIVVFAAGNEGTSSHTVDTFPALFGLDDTYPVFVVGATTQRGLVSEYSQVLSNDKTIWAPGDDLVCATHEGKSGFVTRSGTSFAASMVAGLISYFYALKEAPAGMPRGNTAADVGALRDFILNTASRSLEGPDVGLQKLIYNLVSVNSLDSNETSSRPVNQSIIAIPDVATY